MDSAVWITLALTLKVAGWATAINLVLGVAVGWLLARRRFVGREFVDAVLTLPLVLPPTVMGYYLLVVIGKRGWLGHWLQQTFGINLIFTWQGAVIAATIVAFPLILKSARTAFEAVDPQLEKAARARAERVGGVLPCHGADGLARHPGRRAAGVRTFARRVRCHADGGRQHPRPHANALDRGVRGRAGGAGRDRQLPGGPDLDHLRRRAAGRRATRAHGARGEALR
jgi:hypothetical protein